MKRVEYFNSTYELNNYYPNGVSNDVLAIVGDEDATVLFTSSNNQPVSGSIPTGESQGGFVPPEGYIFPQGYAYITANGDHDVSAYAYTNVDVPIPAGYIVPEGTYNITTNGSYSIAAYENVNVNVPVPAGYVIPTGTYNITANGTYVVSGFENAYVNVPSSGSNNDGLSLGTSYNVVEAIVCGRNSERTAYVKGIVAQVERDFGYFTTDATGLPTNYRQRACAYISDDGLMHYQENDPSAIDWNKVMYIEDAYNADQDPEWSSPYYDNTNLAKLTVGDYVTFHGTVLSSLSTGEEYVIYGTNGTVDIKKDIYGSYAITGTGTFYVAGSNSVNVTSDMKPTFIGQNNNLGGTNASYVVTGYCLAADVEITYENTSYTCYAFGVGNSYNESTGAFARYAYIIKDDRNYTGVFTPGNLYTMATNREFSYSSSPIIHTATLVYLGTNGSPLYAARQAELGGKVDMTITDNGTFFAGHAKSVTVNVPKSADFYLYDTSTDERASLISNGDTTSEEIDGNQVTCYTYSGTMSKNSLASTDPNCHRIIDANTGYVLHFTYSDITRYALGESSDGVFEGNVIALNRGDSTYAYDQLNWQLSESSADLYNCTIEFSLKVPVNLVSAGYKYILYIKVTGSVA